MADITEKFKEELVQKLIEEEDIAKEIAKEIVSLAIEIHQKGGVDFDKLEGEQLDASFCVYELNKTLTRIKGEDVTIV